MAKKQYKKKLTRESITQTKKRGKQRISGSAKLNYSESFTSLTWEEIDAIPSVEV
tara:strand:- start:615 stop:779 length:165 start_codon:yes stop_codon:yes gene_type:complete